MEKPHPSLKILHFSYILPSSQLRSQQEHWLQFNSDTPKQKVTTETEVQIPLELVAVYSIVKLKKTFGLKQWLHYFCGF